MDLRQLLDSITPEIYESLKRAIEVGKWPDGRALSDGQKELCIQAVIAYDERKPADQRTGYVPPKSAACEPAAASTEEQKPIRWKE
jgi:uncharacterized protein YeaC (DUF1315 family)